ncbi:hypothetical protein DFA_10500 [Cavenderia fasciculata]|uniref:Methyltransferase type 11 domain-containing protein n=1 Tax=Cavenderia fasciculata TaxID=261658 RepID=F4QAD9_CACFS|nr:uncharacterized protein DFA_10500 [Cavenderia fasciculata]EGG15658.1 hypothetical protein DFA_10500 [Cavenderia fasciculata]|eukprot:XP_004354400.1 hypothetical protein DFA_10500 [Cavenderia fasciculata]
MIMILMMSSLQQYLEDYGEKDYWDERYVKDIVKRPHFDWYHGYKTLKPFLQKFFKRQDKIMMLGCGNSALGEDMNLDHYLDIVNIDFSSVIIQDMIERTKGRVGLEYLTMDGRNMEFPNEYFDSIFDKGTIDAVMCSDSDNQNAVKMVAEVARVLKPGGYFVVMTYGAPEGRMPLFQVADYNWSIEMRMLGTHENAQMNECHYAYILKKNNIIIENGDAASSTDDNDTDTNQEEEFKVYLNSSIGKVPLEIIPIVK